jgi:hypothetical protein
MDVIPEWWANESLAILEETLGVANLVHRDFSTLIASHDDAVNARRPAAFSTKRKPQFDSPVNLWHEYKTTTQEPTLTNWI